MDTITLSDAGWAKLVGRAVLLGTQDARAGQPIRDTRQVLAALGVVRWRDGHATYLRRAYTAGRWHAEVRGRPTK